METHIKTHFFSNTQFLYGLQSLWFFSALLLYTINVTNNHLIPVVFLEYYLLFTFLYICCVSLKRYALTSAFSLFLFGYFMFQISALFVSFHSIAERELIQTAFVFSEIQIKNTLCANALILSGMFLGVLITNPSKTVSFISNTHFNIHYSSQLQKWGRGIFIFSLPFTLFKFYLEIKLILSQGYYAYYTSALSIPIIVSASRVFFEFGYFIFIASLPDKKEFKKISKIYLIVISLFFLVGIRNRVILSFLFVLWFYYKFYSQKSPKMLLIIVLGIISIFILLLVQYIRQSGIFILNDNRSLIEYFLYAQSTNFYILPLMQYFDLHSDVPYLFAPLINIDTGGYSPDSPSNLLGNAIAYNISQEKFSNGQGLGSSFIAELYDFGVIGLTIIPIILGYFIGWFEKNVSKNRVLLIISFYIITNCIYISRSSLLRNVYMMISLLVIVNILLRLKYPLKRINA